MKVRDVAESTTLKAVPDDLIVRYRKVFRESRARVIPVFKSMFSDQIIGFVTRHDILAATSHRSQIRIVDVVREFPLLTEDMDVNKAFEVLQEFGLEAAVVVDDPNQKNFRGIFTLRNLLKKLIEEGREPIAKTVSDVMTPLEEAVEKGVVAVATYNERVDRVWWKFVRGVKAVIVVNDMEEKRPVGIVTPHDLIKTSRWFFHRESESFKVGMPKIRRVMTRGVVVATPDTPIDVVAKFIVENDFTVIPVVDKRGKLIGVVTQHDVVRAYLLGAKPARPAVKPIPMPTPAPALPKEVTVPSTTEQALKLVEKPVVAVPEYVGIKAADIMRTELPAVRVTDTLEHARKLMLVHKVNVLLVLDDEGNIIGTLSKRDMLRGIAERGVYWKKPTPFRPWREATMPTRHGLHVLKPPTFIEEIMNKNVPKVPKDAPIEEVAYAMISSDSDTVFVVDETGKIIGVITKDDVIRAFPKDRSKKLLVENVMTPKKVGIVRPHTSLAQVLKRMKEFKLDAVVVEEGNEIKGIVSENRLVFVPLEDAMDGRLSTRVLWVRKLVHGGERRGRYIKIMPLTAMDAAAKVTAAVTPKDPVARAIELMEKENIDGVAVVDPEEGVIGIVCKMDLIRELARTYVAVKEAEEKAKVEKKVEEKR